MGETGKEKDGQSLGSSFVIPTPNFSLPNQFGTSSNLFSNLATGPNAHVIFKYYFSFLTNSDNYFEIYL